MARRSRRAQHKNRGIFPTGGTAAELAEAKWRITGAGSLAGGAAQGEPVGQIWLDPFLGAGERHTGMQKERADPAEREEGTR